MRHLVIVLCALTLVVGCSASPEQKEPEAPKTVVVGSQAPEFKIKNTDGEEIDLATLTANGPVLVRLTCGCLGCDKELAYFQSIHKSYKEKGLTSLAIFREPDEKVEQYVKGKSLNMLYAGDAKGESWGVFQTKTMPTNFLIDQGGRIESIAAGCDPSGLVAKQLSSDVAGLLETQAIDPQAAVHRQSEADEAAPKSD